MSESALLSGEEGSSWAGAGAGGWFSAFCRDDARLVEFEVEDEVESSGISTTFQVCSVASGAKETRRFALSELVSLHESPNMGAGAYPWTSGELLFVEGLPFVPVPSSPSPPVLGQLPFRGELPQH